MKPECLNGAEKRAKYLERMREITLEGKQFLADQFENNAQNLSGGYSTKKINDTNPDQLDDSFMSPESDVYLLSSKGKRVSQLAIFSSGALSVGPHHEFPIDDKAADMCISGPNKKGERILAITIM